LIELFLRNNEITTLDSAVLPRSLGILTIDVNRILGVPDNMQVFN
jgi:hypothetical protein